MILAGELNFKVPEGPATLQDAFVSHLPIVSAVICPVICPVVWVYLGRQKVGNAGQHVPPLETETMFNKSFRCCLCAQYRGARLLAMQGRT